MDSSFILNGKTYTTNALPAKRGMRLFVRVGRMLGPAFGRIAAMQIAVAKGATKGLDAEAADIAGLFQEAFTNLDEGPLEETIDELMATIDEDGAPLKDRWTAVFAGQLFSMSKVLWFAVNSHFGDFLNGFASPQNSMAPSETKPKTEIKKRA